MYQIEGVTKSARRQRRERLLVNGVLDDSDKIIDPVTTPTSPSSTPADDNTIVEAPPQINETPSQENVQTDVNVASKSPSTVADENAVVEAPTENNVPPTTQTTIQSDINPEPEPIQPPLGTHPSIFWFLVLLLAGGGFITGIFYFLNHILHP